MHTSRLQTIDQLSAALKTDAIGGMATAGAHQVNQDMCQCKAESY